MQVKEVLGADLVDGQIDTFTAIVRQAYGNLKLDAGDHFSPDNVYFYLEYEGDTVAFGRYVKVEGIKIDGTPWQKPVFGRSLIAVLKQYRGKGFGKMIVLRMRAYAQSNHLSHIGIHGKDAQVNPPSTMSLSEFYENCGLQIDYQIGNKTFASKDGVLHNLGHTNISYGEGDSFIEAVRESREGAVLPFSW